MDDVTFPGWQPEKSINVITGAEMTQVFVNVGGNVGIMPITGIPLPLMSYGGSSVIVTLIALGILQSVYVQAREAAAGKSESLG